MSEENQQQNEHEQVETVTKAEYDSLLAERDSLLEYKPAEVSEKEKAMQIKEQDLWQKEVNLSLKENGLESFASIIKVANEEELKSTIASLNSVISEIKASTGYVPSDHKQVTAYDQAKQSGNTKGMIKSLFKL